MNPRLFVPVAEYEELSIETLHAARRVRELEAILRATEHDRDVARREATWAKDEAEKLKYRLERIACMARGEAHDDD